MPRSARRPAGVLASILAATLILTACGGGGGGGGAEEASAPTAAPSAKTQKVNLLIDFFPNGNHALFYVARDKGYFAKEGLDVNIKHILGGAEVAKSVIAGKAQFGYADLATMAVARSKQQADVRAVMGIQQETPMAILSRADEGIKAPADLAGKKVVDFAGSSTQIVWPVFLRENGLKKDDVELQLVDPGSRLSLAIQGKADAAILFFSDNLPTMRAQCKCEVNAIPWKDNGIDTLSNGIIASEEYIAANPDTIKGFVRALQSAMTFAGENPEEAADIIMKAQPDLGNDKAVVAETVKNAFSLARTEHNQDKPLGYMAPEDWDATLALMVAAGQMDAAGDPSQYFTNEFVPAQP
jgi:NitT/TauT family transport system substrate-binding protein